MLYKQIVGIPMSTDCASIVDYLFLFCYERDFMISLSDDNQADISEAFNSTSGYLKYLLDDNVFSINASLPYGTPMNTGSNYYQIYFGSSAGLSVS